MIVSSNSTKFLESFKKVQETFERKLNSVVRGFAYSISEEAIKHTPLGNAKQYKKLYKKRQQLLGLDPEEGFARGSWQVSTDGQFTVQSLYGIDSGSRSLALVSAKLSGMTINNTKIYIGNRGYYIGMLEANHSQQTMGLGIMKPTQAMVLSSFAIDVKALYEKG